MNRTDVALDNLLLPILDSSHNNKINRQQSCVDWITLALGVGVHVHEWFP